MTKSFQIKLNGTEITNVRQLQEAKGNFYSIQIINTNTKEVFDIEGQITKFTAETRFGYTAWVLDIQASEYEPIGYGELFDNAVVIEMFHKLEMKNRYELGFAVKYN